YPLFHCITRHLARATLFPYTTLFRSMPEAVVIANEEKYLQLKEALSDLPIKVYAGADALSQIVESQPIDIVLASMVGYAGLRPRSEEHTSELQSRFDLVCRLLLEKKN